VRISDDQRRARLAVRHGLAPEHHLPTVADAAAAVVALHATEPASVHLAALARTGADLGTIDDALYDERSVVKQLAMRRTVFAFPRALLPAVWGSAAARVASQQRRQLARQVVEAGIATDGAVWVRETTEAVLAALREHGPMTTSQLRGMLPALDSRLTYAEGKSYAATTPIAPRVLTTLAASGAVLRGANEGGWKLSRPRWTLAGDWLGEQPEPLDERAGYAVLVEAWLRSFGPGTEADLVWWLGATRSAVRRALADVGAVEVDLDGGAVGVVLPDDVDPVGPPGRWAALLPALDPTTMGWKQRDFYLRPDHTPYLFDTNGNAGSTAWWNGRVVGCWVQDGDGVVQVLLREDVGAEGRAALDAEAERLTAFLDGVRIRSVYASRQMRGATLP